MTVGWGAGAAEDVCYLEPHDIEVSDFLFFSLFWGDRYLEKLTNTNNHSPTSVLTPDPYLSPTPGSHSPQPLTDPQALHMDEVQRANLRFAVINLGKEAGQRDNAGGGSLADVD